MAFGIGRGLTAPLMVINFILYFIAACLAGSILNRNLDANAGQNDDLSIGNVVTPMFIPIVLIACMAGPASVFAGAHHVRVWRTESLAAAAATSLIAWLLTLLAMGLACKEIHTRYGRSKRLVSTQLLCTILCAFQFLLKSITSNGAVTCAPARLCESLESTVVFLMKTVEAFMIILSLFELLYLLATHAGSVTGEGYGNAPGHHAAKNPHHGTPAATAV